MQSVVRGVFAYLVVLACFRFSGKRSIDMTSPIEFILLLMIGGVAVPAMQGEDHSLTGAVLLLTTLIASHNLAAWLKLKSSTVRRIVEGTPIVVLESGEMRRDRMRRLLINEQDIASAMRAQGVEKMEHIRHAVVERNGSISVVAKDGDGAAS